MVDIKKLRFTFGLSVTSGDILYLLLNEDLVSNEDLAAVCKNPRVAMYRLRQVLTPLNIEVQVRRELGYWITPDHKQAIIDIVEPPPEVITKKPVTSKVKPEKVEELVHAE